MTNDDKNLNVGQEINEQMNKLKKIHDKKGITKKVNDEMNESPQDNKKMDFDEKKGVVKKYIEDNFIKNDTAEIVAYDAFKKMKEATKLKLMLYQFLTILRTLNIKLEKKEKYYIIGYKLK